MIEIRNYPLTIADFRYIIPIEMESDNPPYWTYDDFQLVINQCDKRIGFAAIMKDEKGNYLKKMGDPRVIGFVCIQFVEHFFRFKGKIILIDKLVVDKNFRRQGVGTALLTSVVSLVTKNMPLIAFPVRMDNTDGQLFLQNCIYGSKKMGTPEFNLYNFHHCGFIREYFSNGDAASVFLYKKSPF